MTSRWASARLLAIALAIALVTARPLAAQGVRELGVQGTVLASNPAVIVGGVYGGLRTSIRTRVAAMVSAGTAGGAFAWRAELLGQFLLNPRRTTGAGVYGGGGVAVAGSGGREQGYAVVLLGVEARPGAASGWFIEAGLGGGFRGSAGIRWRWRR